MTRHKHGNVMPEMKFKDFTEEQLQDMYYRYFPAGSGPLGVMRMVCKLIEVIAEERGYDINTWKKLR